MVLGKQFLKGNILATNPYPRFYGNQVTRVNSANVLNEGLRIGEIGRRMNSKVKLVKIGVLSKVNLGVQPGLLSICPTPSPLGPYI
jgi:hypothetical protein